jgi:hypothetical protein
MANPATLLPGDQREQTQQAATRLRGAQWYLTGGCDVPLPSAPEHHPRLQSPGGAALRDRLGS